MRVLDQGKNAFFNLISQQDDTDKIYLHAKDLSEPNYEFLIKKCKNIGIKHFDEPMYLLSVQILWMTFMRILMITKEPYSFLTIRTTLPASDLLRFRKKLFQSYKNDSS